MNIEELREYCMAMDGATEKTPFGKFARRYESVLVFYVLDHMFCYTDMDDFSWVNVKSTPDEIEELKSRHMSAGNPLNMDPRHWVRLELNGDISDKDVLRLIDRSYELVRDKYTPKSKRTKH